MLHKKGLREKIANYRAICLLCHSYKLLSAVVARRLMAGWTTDYRTPMLDSGRLEDEGTTYTCILRCSIDMVLREGRQAVVTFIDYSAEFRHGVRRARKQWAVRKFGALSRPYAPQQQAPCALSSAYILATAPVYDPTELSRANRVATVQRTLLRPDPDLATLSRQLMCMHHGAIWCLDTHQ